jgi:hypothetical protein
VWGRRDSFRVEGQRGCAQVIERVIDPPVTGWWDTLVEVEKTKHVRSIRLQSEVREMFATRRLEDDVDGNEL